MIPPLQICDKKKLLCKKHYEQVHQATVQNKNTNFNHLENSICEQNSIN